VLWPLRHSYGGTAFSKMKPEYISLVFQLPGFIMNQQLFSEAEMAAGVFSGSVEYVAKNVVRQISYRIPVRQLSMVDALASMNPGMTRTDALVLLLDVAIEEVTKHMNPAKLAEVRDRAVTCEGTEDGVQ
jgi:hypothetical protein